MDNVLVTGATGYIGSEIVAHLLRDGKQVTALGRTKPQRDDQRDIRRDIRRDVRHDISFLKADLTDSDTLKQTLQGKYFDVVMHLASLPGDTGNPEQMVKVNVNGCHNLLEYARDAKIKRFILASSVSAYEWYPATKFNPPDYMPVDENHPCRPKDMYSTTKRTQELLALTYYHQYSVPATILRLTAVIGPRGKGGGRGWRKFAEDLAQGQRVQIPHFSSDELCHYVDIRDVARMFITAGEHEAAKGEVFNCCGPGPTRGSEFTEIIKSLVSGIKVECGFPWSMAQGGEISFDMSKARRLIDFVPKYTVEDSINYIKEWIDTGALGRDDMGGKESFTKGVKEKKN